MKKYLPFIVLVFVSLFSSCSDRTSEKKEAEINLQRTQTKEARSKARKNALDEILARHGSTYLSPEFIGPKTRAYDFQRFFKKNLGSPISFKGFFIDLSEVDGKIVGEFISPIGSELGILFELTVSESRLQKFISTESRRIDRFHYYFITGKVDSSEKNKPIMTVLPDFLPVKRAYMTAKGEFIDAVEVPSN